MKLLEKGREQKGWAHEFKCTGEGNGYGGCGARLLVEQADVYETSSGYYDGSTDYYRTFDCPECGVATHIPESVRLPFKPGPRPPLPSKHPRTG